MTEFSKSLNCEVRESNKLVGPLNYGNWQIKMIAILKREGLWPLVGTKITTIAYPVTVEGVAYTEVKLNEAKQRALTGLTMSISDNLLRTIDQHDDPADAWSMLLAMSSAGDQQQIQMISNKLHAISMRKGEDINNYLTTAMDLRNELRGYGEEMTDKTLINLVLNGLPSSYDVVMQGITYLDNPKFEVVMGKLIAESHRKALRAEAHSEALAIQYSGQRGAPAWHQFGARPGAASGA